jgi:hypothetical protein
MKLNLQDIINECEEHINAPNCEGCPFGGPEGNCLVQHSPVSWNLEFLTDLLDKHFDEQNLKGIHFTNGAATYMFCNSHRHANGLASVPEPSIESICERDCTVYLTCPLLLQMQQNGILSQCLPA